MSRENSKYPDAVVFCSCYYTSLGLVRCLGEAGYKLDCICYDEYFSPSEHLLASKYISRGWYFKSAEECVRFLMEDYPCYSEKPVLFTIPDIPAYQVDINMDCLKDKFILMSAGKQGEIARLMDKSVINNLAQKYALKTPWYMLIKKGSPIPDDIKYPVFTKSIKTVDGGKSDECICQDKNQLESIICSALSDCVLVMEYIRKKVEINYFGIAYKSHVYIDYFDRRERAIEGKYGHYNSFHICEHDEFHHRLVEMIKETGYNGLFDVEFLQDQNGVSYFMEINFRTDGEVYKLVPGINQPAIWCELVRSGDDSIPESLPTGKNNFTGMTEAMDFKENVLTGRVNAFKWLMQFLCAKKHMLINLRDPRPACIKWGKALNRVISRG